MEENLRQVVIKRTCASIYLGCLFEYKRNLEELCKSWQNALKRHDANRPGILLRIVSSGAAHKSWLEKREALAANLASCGKKVAQVSQIIESGNNSPEVIQYVEALAGQLQAAAIPGD